MFVEKVLSQYLKAQRCCFFLKVRYLRRTRTSSLAATAKEIALPIKSGTTNYESEKEMLENLLETLSKSYIAQKASSRVKNSRKESKQLNKKT